MTDGIQGNPGEGKANQARAGLRWGFWRPGPGHADCEFAWTDGDM